MSICPILRAGTFSLNNNGQPTARKGESDCVGKSCAVYETCQVKLPKLLDLLIKEKERDDLDIILRGS